MFEFVGFLNEDRLGRNQTQALRNCEKFIQKLPIKIRNIPLDPSGQLISAAVNWPKSVKRLVKGFPTSFQEPSLKIILIMFLFLIELKHSFFGF